MSERTVVCVLWIGDFRGRTFSPEWVKKLHRMVKRHLDGPYRFVCLSNTEIDGIETIPLIEGWPGWWAKIEMFRPGLFTGRVLYLDLDVLITGDLAPLFERPGDFVAMKADVDWATRISEGKRVTAGLNSGTMAWTAGTPEVERLFTEFRPEFMKVLRGDQDWITEQMPHPRFFPKQWFARLRDHKDGPPPDCRVFHVMPFKNDLASRKIEWVREAWG